MISFFSFFFITRGWWKYYIKSFQLVVAHLFITLSSLLYEGIFRRRRNDIFINTRSCFRRAAAAAQTFNVFIWEIFDVCLMSMCVCGGTPSALAFYNFAAQLKRKRRLRWKKNVATVYTNFIWILYADDLFTRVVLFFCGVCIIFFFIISIKILAREKRGYVYTAKIFYIVKMRIRN